MIDITGKNVKLWVNDREGKNGTFQTYSVSFSKKVESKYVNKPVKVFLSREIEKPDHIENGTLIDFEGFPTLDIYTDRDGNERREVAIFITSIRWNDADASGFAEAEEQIPF